MKQHLVKPRMANSDVLHIQTPLIYSNTLSKFAPDGRGVYLKMESCQISGSFKMRGIGRLAQKLKSEGYDHFIAASGGNAGLAVATAAKSLGVKCTVYVPETSTEEVIKRVRLAGAEVVVHGSNFKMTEKLALKVAEAPGAAYISPYDHPEIWAGHSTMIEEAVQQMPEKPGCIVVSVGGGGLLAGILMGLKTVGWQDVPVLAMETFGAHCFNLTVQAKKIVPLENITSIATCLGACTITSHLFNILPQFNVTSQVVSDWQAVESIARFADDERVLVEAGCGAALSALYFDILKHMKMENGPILMIVCGGSNISLSLLSKWIKQFEVKYDG